MIRHVSLLTVLMMTMLITGGAHATTSQQAIDTCRERSNEILQSLQKSDFVAATRHFDTRVRSKLDAQKLGQVWTQLLPSQAGAYEHAQTTQVNLQGDNAIAETPLHFAHAWRSMKVSCDQVGQVSGLFFAPTQAPNAVNTTASTTYALAPNEHELATSSPLGPLPATLTLPDGAGPFPAVLLIAGSGPSDRDTTIGPNKAFRDLAQGLAAAGIASFRYDKRTKTYGAEMVGKAITVDDEVTDDATSAFHLLAAQAHIDPRRVFVLGHSLGGLMAPRIGQRVPEAAGLILLAAPVTLNLDVVLRQTRYIASLHGASGVVLEQLTAPIITARDTLAHADAAHPPAGIFFHAPASYWLSLRDYDAVATAKHLHMPMLILQGERDYQVTPSEDFAHWRTAFAGDKRVQLKLYPGLSHLFMPGSNPPSPSDYERAGHVDTQVIRDIAAWINNQPAAKQMAPR